MDPLRPRAANAANCAAPSDWLDHVRNFEM
jgi:hypothetical protein